MPPNSNTTSVPPKPKSPVSGPQVELFWTQATPLALHAWVYTLSGPALTPSTMFLIPRPRSNRSRRADPRPVCNLRCEAPLRDKKNVCRECFDVGPMMNCEAQMPACGAPIWISCGKCLRMLCHQHCEPCYCFKRKQQEQLAPKQNAPGSSRRDA